MQPYKLNMACHRCLLHQKINVCVLQVGIQRWTKYISSSASDDYQYLQKSKLPMLHFQPSLPRLPVPKLKATCERYLNAQKPLLDDGQFKNTEDIVRKFQENEGKALQVELTSINKKNRNTSYICKPWFDMYLESRNPVVLNYNPYLGFADDPQPAYNDQVVLYAMENRILEVDLIRASNMLISSLRFMRSLRARLLEPEIFHLNPSKSDNDKFRRLMRLIPSPVSWYGAFLYKAFPLDMSQYQGLFNATRIPKHGRDELLGDQTTSHMLVLRNGHFYVFDVLDSHGCIREPAYIHACLKHVLSENRLKAEFPVAAFTTENRDVWATSRQHLIDIGNADVLRLIDTAIFALELDDETSNNDPVTLSKLMLHGDGSNRWFDKSLQLIVTKDGKAGINFEHSWGDGVAVLRYFNEIFKDSTAEHFIHPNSTPMSINPKEVVRHLEFKLDERAKDGITVALKTLNESTSMLNFNVVRYKKYGKNVIKKQKVSPDALMQLAFQMAYYRLTGKTVATYESCSTAAFRHGRTETIRSATMATKKCCEAFQKPGARPPPDELRSLIEDCSHVHGRLVKEAALGQGFDRHLFVLRTLAKKAKNDPEIFRDDAYQSINHIVMSTSTLNSDALLVASFGPVVADGLGIGYLVSDDALSAMITSYASLNDGSGFAECLTSSLDEIYQVFASSSANK